MKTIILSQDYYRVKRKHELQHYETVYEKYIYALESWMPVAIAYGRSQNSADYQALKKFNKLNISIYDRKRIKNI